jgi:phosphate transport system protein
MSGQYCRPVPEELRHEFHRDLERINRQVIGLFALVGECVAGATDALLSGDREAAKVLVARDQMIDETYRDIEELVHRQLSLQSPMARDLRFLLTVLRIVPELERSADLAEHIAQRAVRGLTPELTPRVRGLVDQMGRVAVEMWHAAADAYAERDADAHERLNEQDDELDDLHVSLTAEISSGKLSIPVVIEMALIARFYERLGDHAVNVARQVRYLATGDS